MNLLIKDADLLPDGHRLALYTEIPKQRSTVEFLKRLI